MDAYQLLEKIARWQANRSHRLRDFPGEITRDDRCNVLPVKPVEESSFVQVIAQARVAKVGRRNVICQNLATDLQLVRNQCAVEAAVVR